MPRPSSIDRQPPEIRELIGKLRQDGRTIDEILEKLRELQSDVSRSALGRHVKQLDAIGEEIRRSRAAADAIVQRFGDAPESRTARLNIELMHSLLMKLLVGEDGGVVKLEPQEAFFVSTSLQKLAQASKSDVDREVIIRKDLAARLDKDLAKVETEARAAGEQGLSAERIAQLRREFLGVKQP
jgi:DNA-binding transcriptional ArsR family regulator